jgi:predicted dehydrogenase
MVVYDDTSIEPVRIYDSGANVHTPESFGEYKLTYRTGDILSPKVEVTEPLALQFADFCRAVRDGTKPKSSVEIGYDVLRITEAADRSLDLGGRPVLVERDDVRERAPSRVRRFAVPRRVRR